jgi:acetoin utilization deacetylase AcuC-like enzyme
MLEMLIGFSSQSFLPDLKPEPFRVLCFLAVHSPNLYQFLKEIDKEWGLTLRSFVPQAKKYFNESY